MEIILSFVVGLVVGGVVVWWFLDRQHATGLAASKQSAAEELRAEQKRREAAEGRLEAAKAEAALSAERSSALVGEHAALSQRMADAEARREAAEARVVELEAERPSASVDATRVTELEERVLQPETVIERLKAPRSEAARAAPLAAVAEAPDPPAVPSDLTRIKGIGPVFEKKLHNLGIFTFQQIADFTAADIERVNTLLDFPGRVERDGWVQQARAMIENRTT